MGLTVHDVVDVVEGVEGARLLAAVPLDDGVEGRRGVGGEQPEVPHEVLLLHQLRDCTAEPLAKLTGRARVVLLSDLGRRGEHDGISVPAGRLLVSVGRALSRPKRLLTPPTCSSPWSRRRPSVPRSPTCPLADACQSRS